MNQEAFEALKETLKEISNLQPEKNKELIDFINGVTEENKSENISMEDYIKLDKMLRKSKK